MDWRHRRSMGILYPILGNHALRVLVHWAGRPGTMEEGPLTGPGPMQGVWGPVGLLEAAHMHAHCESVF